MPVNYNAFLIVGKETQSIYTEATEVEEWTEEQMAHAINWAYDDVILFLSHTLRRTEELEVLYVQDWFTPDPNVISLSAYRAKKLM